MDFRHLSPVHKEECFCPNKELAVVIKKGNTIMIDIVKSGNTNCYLINTGNKNILVDTGTIADEQFLQKLKAKIPLEQIDLIILTHGHYDHVEYASVLQKEYGISILLHKNDLDKVTRGSMDFPPAKGFFSNFIRDVTLSGMKKAAYTPFTPDIVIENGNMAEYPDIQIIPLPGHTPGSIGIIFENNLFAGDLMMNMPFPSMSWFAEDFDILSQSIKKIQHLNLNRIYPGHGKSFSYSWLKYF